jgi:hypothetical protein
MHTTNVECSCSSIFKGTVLYLALGVFLPFHAIYFEEESKKTPLNVSGDYVRQKFLKSSFKLLDVLFDEFLSFKPHIDMLCCVAFRFP